MSAQATFRLRLRLKVADWRKYAQGRIRFGAPTALEYPCNLQDERDPRLSTGCFLAANSGSSMPAWGRSPAPPNDRCAASNAAK